MACVVLFVLSGLVKARQGKTRKDKKRKAKPSQAKTRQDKTRQDKTRQDNTKQDKIKQDKIKQDKTLRIHSTALSISGVVPWPFAYIRASWRMALGRPRFSTTTNENKMFMMYNIILCTVIVK
jgi:hypothetical protein